MNNFFDCIIYCSGKMSVHELRNKIAFLLNAEKTAISFIETDFYEISIHPNKEYNSEREREFPDGFLFFKYIIDIGFDKTSNQKKCIEEVSKILNWLWETADMSAIASCNYEDLLPNKGGYKAKEIPWPR